MNTPTSNESIIRSIAGFMSALIIGALIPRTFTFLVRRILLRSFREVFVLALAGWLTDRLVRWLSDSRSLPTRP